MFQRAFASIMRSSNLGAYCIDISEYANEVQLDYKQMNKLGRGWRDNHTKVNLYLIFCGITALCGASH